MNDMNGHQSLPPTFCWTRFGPEAGEAIQAILIRKERERRANSGVFYWGIGNSVAAGIAELARSCRQPEVLFSPIKSRPRSVDVDPPTLVQWVVGETLTGERLELPPSVRVIGRGGASVVPPHYALVCSSDDPLVLGDFGKVRFGEVRNLLSGKRLGTSQVTAIVRYLGKGAGTDHGYRVALRARLTPPYFVRLRDPIDVGCRG